MDKPLFLFVGKSASGKTTVAETLVHQYGHEQVYSYCTRPPRFNGEIGHTFISDEQFNNLGKLAAYTEYNGYRYGTTVEQLDQCDIYVVDVPGVETLLENYKTNRRICIIYFDATVHTRINRMLDRHDSDTAIISRLLQDEKDDWFKKLSSLTWVYEHAHSRIIDLFVANANMSLNDVVQQVLFYMEVER